ncbi:serine/threonine-protein kinase Nek4 isoform X2 [Silurus meridionalis]|uniref:serine/threonine-protein kinase Nek4 isoform X2 n=1 Tax=Silurus meridionalis TaxID=175797 RepID=UPI001EEAA49E|nr:serine/threonine-protein kinase Nek4 isoform X2 [Silurus meridionalis]
MESYVFLRVVGKGSYGEVNLVQHKSDRKQYVIKKLNLRTSSKRERRAAEQEAQLLSQLKHPNIVTYRESWEGKDHQLYIVMGFCEGGDLYHRLKQQKNELLPERQVVEWFVQIAMALQYLHEKHILHRDLKTQNIFLTKTNIIKVGDLGIARVLENQNDMASTLIGTPYYMSPELFSNKPYNYKSDVWALGCCVYEMATLKHAFNAKDMNSLVYRIVEGKLPQMPSKYDPQLGYLIRRMLCKRPDDRPDVKHILRQPYIKQQIAVFLEATKEKTAKSRKKVNSRPSRDAPEVPVLQKQESQYVNSELKSRGNRSDENCSQHSKTQNGTKDVNPLPTPPQSPNTPSQEILNSTSQNIATISNIDIQLQEHVDKLRKAKPPRPAAKQTEKEEKKKKDDAVPQPHPRKQVSGVLMGKYEPPLVSKSSRGTMPSKHTERIEPVKDSRGLNLNMSAEEDTLKLLQQAAKEDIKTDKQDIREAKEVQKTEAEYCLEDKGTSLESTDKLLEPFVLVELMEPHTPKPLASLSENSKSPLHPLSSLSEPSLSRQHRQKKGEVAREESKIKAANSRPLPPLPEIIPSVGINRIEGGEAEMVKHPPHSQADHQHEPAPQNRPLSARERRRLRKSQENQSVSAPVVRSASCDGVSLNTKHTDHLDCPRPASVAAVTHKEPHTPEPLASPSENSKSPLHPLSSFSEPSLSRQSRQKKGEVAHEESKMKAANSRPLPPLSENYPSVGINRIEGGEAEMVKHPPHSQADHQHEPAPQNRPLSARERRRLRKSQENQSVSAAPVVRSASCDGASLNAKHTDHLDCPRPASVAAVTHKEKKSSWHHSDEEECSSSTSSTERSEGDYREGKSESNEMQDLVQMMTQTLRMDVRDPLCEQQSSRSNSTMLPEFKLNRKYRDTLMLHGKSGEGDGDFHLSDLRSDDSSGPAKIRRAVEHLRTDVVKGLGVKLLDKVLDIMQEDDEDKREVMLRQQMGDEKYKAFAVKVWQLKFFEDVALKC